MAKLPNKVVYGNRTLVDMTDATATASDLLIGKSAYVADGSKATGTLDLDGVMLAVSKTQAHINYPGIWTGAKETTKNLKSVQDRLGFPGVFPSSSKVSSGVVRRFQDQIGYPGVYVAEESEASP